MTDLYVTNDTTENQMWINRGDGKFEDRAMASGSAVNGDGSVEAGMGVVAADLDRDGDQDLFLTHNARETNTLYVNDGSGRFTDATNRFGLGNPSLPHTGFGVVSADFDADGLLDIFVANGAVAIMEALRGDPFPFRQPNQIYRGLRNGFDQVGELEAWGSLQPLVGRGVAQGDIDLDGDIDLVVANNNGPVRLYLNQFDANHSLKVKLDGLSGNRNGIGAQVRLCSDDGTCATRRLHRDGSYLSSSEAAVYFTQSVNASPSRVEVRWPSGRSERFPVPAGRTEVRLHEGSGEPFGHASPDSSADL